MGNIVLVPFKNRKIKGVVLDISKKSPVKKVKEIQAVFDFPSLLPYQIELAKWISSYYLAPLYKTIQAILPPFVKRIKPYDLLVSYKIKSEKPPKLTFAQEKIVKMIAQSLERRAQNYLLHGVTSSGKTEVYLQVLDKILKEKKQVLILVPEISLTPQTISRFLNRFGKKIAILHSKLTPNERFGEWQKIYNNKVKIVIGSRSAIFAPFSNLGLIILDEEHDQSYKQDMTPRYDARTVALKLQELIGAKVIFGSATPRIESYYQAQEGKFTLLELEERIHPPMPEVKIIDLREEVKLGNKSIFSTALYEAIKKTLSKAEQVILFINRRGAATYIFCQDCGYILKCPNCEIPLIYHEKQEKHQLLCHHCNYQMVPPNICPNCQSHKIKYFGLGTQKVEREVRKLFPDAKIKRMDKDTIRTKEDYFKIYNDMLEHKIDVLVGTQMLTFGFDLPKVSLVGVVFADTALNFPDFRAEENTFQLLTQVAGRAGRKKDQGLVIIQTYNPENPAILASQNHDFNLKEIDLREKLNYPPFCQIIRLVYTNSNESKVQKEAEVLCSKLKAQGSRVIILGPAPCFLAKIRGKYRWQILIKLPKNQRTEKQKNSLLNLVPKGWSIDVDPISML